jgi:isochorismate pyruvate lyase
MSKLWTLPPLSLLLVLAFAAGAEESDPDRPAYRGTPGAAGGTCCRTLGEVRGNIDRLDRQILALIAERGSFVHEAARFKANPDAVEDPHRVEQIIAEIRALAVRNQLSPEVAEATYRAMIAAFTAEERRLVEQQSAPGEHRPE